MLKIESKPTFTAKVKVHTAAIRGEFNAVFLALPTDELEALDTGEPKAWRDVLKAVVVQFDPMVVGDENLNGAADELPRLIRWPGVGPAMLAAYYDGLWSEAQGN